MEYTLVTGGAKNLGKEIALTLAKNKFNTLVHYNKSSKEAFEVVQECRSFGVEAESIQGDFSTIAEIKEFTGRLTKQFPNIKNLVNNVGNYLVKNTLKTSLEEMQALFSTNLYAPFCLIQALMPTIQTARGSVINIGVCGIESQKAESYSTAYSLTKSSLLMLTRSLAKEFAAFDVAINMVSPGILEGSIDIPKDLDKIPMKRLGTLVEVADVVLFLLNQNNHYITGQNIEVAGGLRL